MTAQAAGTVGAEAARARSAVWRWWLLAIALVTIVAGVLRLIALGTVPEDLYYDAAVRSMTLSLHNFFFGAFDPTAMTQVDKPPLDLWLQVIAVKVLGWGPVALKLPEALAGTAAIPLLFDLVRRVAGPLVGLASAITLALLPTSVITARSDTMDSLMMLLILVVAWLLLRGAQRRELRWLIWAAVVLGVDFNVKLFEALVPVPAFLLFVWLCWRGEPIAVRLRRLAAAGAVFAVIGLSWIVAVSVVPTAHRPYAIGSTNGSIWNAVFVFNGLDHVTQAPQPRSFSTVSADLPVAHTAAASSSGGAQHTSSTSLASPAGPLRLFQYSLVGYGTRLGTILFAAIVFGLVGLAPLLRRRLRPPPDASREKLIVWAATLALALWLLSGYLLFSFDGRLQPRYLEAFTPAVAIALGCGIVVAARRARDLLGVYVLLAAFAISMLEGAAETASGKHGVLAVAIGALLAVPVVGYVVFAFAHTMRAGRWPRWYRVEAAVLGTLAALLAFPVVRDVLLIRDRSGAQAAEVTLPAAIVDPISRYLRAHQGSARYELVATSATLAAPFIVDDARPVLLLTTVNAQPLVSLAQLKHYVGTGQVRFEVNHGGCTVFTIRAQCSPQMQWVRANFRDITSLAGLSSKNVGLLYDLRRPLRAAPRRAATG